MGDYWPVAVYPEYASICVAQIQGCSWKRKKKKEKKKKGGANKVKNMTKPEAKRDQTSWECTTPHKHQSCARRESIMPPQDKRLFWGEFHSDGADLAELNTPENEKNT